LDGIHVLIVDDDPDALRLQARVLELAGASVTTASDAAGALRSLDEQRFDVLVSDLAMPDFDGYDLIGRVRSKGYGAESLPALALTAFASAEDERRTLFTGFQDHLAKPVEPQHLVAAVAHLAGKRFGASPSSSS